jgi:hypothetical protein
MRYVLSVRQHTVCSEFDLPDNLSEEELRATMKVKCLSMVRWSYRVKEDK